MEGAGRGRAREERRVGTGGDGEGDEGGEETHFQTTMSKHKRQQRFLFRPRNINWGTRDSTDNGAVRTCGHNLGVLGETRHQHAASMLAGGCRHNEHHHDGRDAQA